MCQAIQTKPKAMDKKIEVFIELHCLIPTVYFKILYNRNSTKVCMTECSSLVLTFGKYGILMYIMPFWVLKALYMNGGNLLIHHQCAASNWMMQRQPYCTRTPTTHQLTGGEETLSLSDKANQCMGMIRRP